MAPRRKSHPNVILLISDTFRYDNLFDRAAMPVRTPCLDRFHQRAVSLSRMHTGSFPTIPQRTDLMTGRCGWPWYGWQDFALSGPNRMTQLLKDAGYVTQLICDCPHLFNMGFQKVFDAAVQTRGQEGDKPFLHMNDPVRQTMPPEKTRKGSYLQGRPLVDVHRWTNHWWQGEEDRFPPRTAKLAVRWLEQNYRYNPFFLWVDFFDPHEPWDPPEYMVRRYAPTYTGTPMLHPNYGKASDYTRAELRNLRAHYCAEAELVDRWVGRVLQKVDDLGLWENSIVVFTSDHGMSLGEHTRTGKTNINDGDDRFWPMYPEIAHIPFLVAAPGLKGDRTVDTFAQPFDIQPTLLDLAGVDASPPEPFHGRSFAGLLAGRSRKPIRDFAVCASSIRSAACPLAPGATTPMLYTDRWAYTPIGSAGPCELYDLKRDPCATKNLARKHPRIAAEMHRTLVTYLEDMDAPPESARALNATR